MKTAGKRQFPIAEGALSAVGASCWIYFVGGSGKVKIGITVGVPTRRLRGLQANSPVPLELLAVMPGHPADEERLHKQFSEFRSHGEWFDSVLPITGLIGEINRNCGCPDPASGVPAHLLTLSEIHLEDRDDDRALDKERVDELKRLVPEVRDYLARHKPLPPDLERKWLRTRALTSARPSGVEPC